MADLAVVGNAGSLLDSEDGNAIDEHVDVARFNNFVIGPVSSTGRRTTIWVTSFFRDDIADRHETFDRVLCPLPRTATTFNRRLFRKWQPECMPDELWRELRCHAPSPSTGLCYLWWLYRERGSLPAVYGFDFFSGLNHHYWQAGPGACRHEGVAEKRLFRLMLGGLV